MLFFPCRLYNFSIPSIFQARGEVWLFRERAAGPCRFSSVLMLLFSIMTEIKIICPLSFKMLQKPFPGKSRFWSQPVQFVRGHCSDDSRHQLFISHTKDFHQSSKRWDVLTGSAEGCSARVQLSKIPGEQTQKEIPNSGRSLSWHSHLYQLSKNPKIHQNPVFLGKPFRSHFQSVEFMWEEQRASFWSLVSSGGDVGALQTQKWESK